MSVKLSILICSLPKRESMLGYISHKIYAQFDNKYPMQIRWDDNEFKSIGEKRNGLLSKADGEYVAFIDDDDDISDNYIDLLMEGINKGVDCCSLKGIYTADGNNPQPFEHSLKYDEWKTIEINVQGYKGPFHQRYPNHLNCIKSSVAKQFKFPEKNFGEDYDWSKQLHQSGLLKTEHYIEQLIYFYKYITKK